MDRCKEHGALIGPDGTCATVKVLSKVWAERSRQFALHGNNLDNESGAGPQVAWAAPLAGFCGAGAAQLETQLRRWYEATEDGGRKVSMAQILLEEFAEAMKEDNPIRLAEELIQVAAVAVSWAEKLKDPESVMSK